MKEQINQIKDQLDRIEEKLDDHMVRLTSAESSIAFIQGHLKLSTTIFLSVVGFLGVTFFKKFFGE